MSKPIQLSTIQCQEWMSRLINRAKRIGLIGEIPVSAVVLDESGHCIGYGSNDRERKKNPLGHAEIMALRQAALIKNDWRLNECTLIVTLEPCPMCTGALIQSRIGQVIFGAKDPKRGALGSVLDLSKDKSAHHKLIVKGGVLEKAAGDQLKEWFKHRREAFIESEVTQFQKD